MNFQSDLGVKANMTRSTILRFQVFFLSSLTGVFAFGCNGNSEVASNSNSTVMTTSNDRFSGETATATFAGGCFWCTEAIYEEVEGVIKVVSGYSGGHVANPSYEAVCDGTTGHAECVQITYDPQMVDFETLLDIHLRTHDPTTLNRQGNDVGTQYRSAVFYHSEAQKAATEAYIAEKDKEQFFGGKIVTEVVPFEVFYVAENYHQDYFANNPDQPYCVFVVKKKVKNFEAQFPDLMKEGYRVK